MNGDEKEEAQRPRPLSGGIWTLFSWLRRSERSSSSDSLSSVGSARTAVSFDFLAPGNCNFTNTPIVLTTPLNPPSETYKKRLQDRNLRRQRDRDITLRRKYGLFREYGSGYDGFSLPPARRVLESPVYRQNRDRRATSECSQRRAAYVPGKRRAPLPPVLTTSATLPRSYKRKRPAPKPPVKSTIKENIDQQINHPVRMNSNLSSEDRKEVTSDTEQVINRKTEKCEKKVVNSKDTKLRTDKGFLKHIFENKKRNSAVETSTLRLLPSISELDKQAAEIIENNKLRRNRSNLLPDENLNISQGSSSTSYEGNSWFCTSCLRKYNSSINTCNYCLGDKNLINNVERDNFRKSFPRSSMYTQTASNVGSTSSNHNNIDERKILKELLKEMKDSLPKKYKDNNKANFITETPTLRIGSTVSETYKDLPASSFSSSIHHNNLDKDHQKNSEATASNRSLSISSLLSESRGNHVNNQPVTSAKPSEFSSKNVLQHKVALAYEGLENKNHSSKVHSQVVLSRNQMKDKSETVKNSSHVEVDDNEKCNKLLLIKTKTENITSNESSIRKILENKNNENIKYVEKSNITKKSNNTSQLISLTAKFTEGKENEKNITDLQIPTVPDSREKVFIDNKDPSQDNTRIINVITKSEKPPSPKTLFLNFPITNAVVVNSVTVVTSQSSNENSKTSNNIPMKNPESHSKNAFTPKTNEAQSSSAQSLTQLSTFSNGNIIAMDNQTHQQRKTDPIKSDDSSSPSVSLKPKSNLNTPLKISTLLNPSYTPRLPIIQEDKPGAGEHNFKKELLTDQKITQKGSAPSSIAVKSKLNPINVQNTEMELLQQAEVVRKEPMNEHGTSMGASDEIKIKPSNFGCTDGVIFSSKNNIDKLDHYDKRRNLINQLEQSIAKGDEVAAAEAAAKLAKLRLSCSVLSFSSQIVGESSKHKEGVSENIVLKQDIKTELQTEKKTDQSIPHTSRQVIKQSDINGIHAKSNAIVNNLEDDKELKKKEIVRLNIQNSSNVKNPLNENQPSTSTQAVPDEMFPIDVWVEDKQAARGPIRLRISQQATIADLRRQAEHSLGLATQLQRWIIGRTLCTDDATTVVSLAGPDLKAPFYLCLVQTEANDQAATEIVGDEKDKNDKKTNENGGFYIELMKLEKQSLVPNVEEFECGVCMEECAAGAGVVLRECIHSFCRACLSDVVQHCQEPVVSCPAMGCSGNLQEREIRTIVSPEEYERWLARGLATAECGTRNAFHCRTRDCTGWAFCDPGVRRFPCPVCNHTNCVQCQAIHEGETCEQHQTKLRNAVAAAETNKDDEGTQSLINSLISRGEALECPECKAIITKKWGCDWVKCSACKTEICWVTKGRRWGPGGRGDTSGGCRCGVDGQRCHPSCGYCH